jgi:putative transposase
MARLARVVGIGLPHYVTQRGNARQFILAADEERLVYLDLFRQYSRLHQLSVLGYCLISNHVHLIVAGASEIEIAAFPSVPGSRKPSQTTSKF